MQLPHTNVIQLQLQLMILFIYLFIYCLQNCAALSHIFINDIDP